jgi:hypothetical protein
MDRFTQEYQQRTALLNNRIEKLRTDLEGGVEYHITWRCRGSGGWREG